MKKSQPAGRQGFTLIELLVVIGIIGLLVAVAVPNFLSARQRASDSRKKTDMSQLKSALRLYYNDFASYPPAFSAGPGMLNYIAGCGATGEEECPCVFSGNTLDFATGAECDTVYMKKFPSNLGSSTFYYQGTNGEDFCLKTTLDNRSDPDIEDSQTRCASACGDNCDDQYQYCDCAN